MVLDGSEGHHMLDNVTITRHGQILLQEDPGIPSGNPNYLAVLWRYTIETDTLMAIAQADPDRFVKGAAGYLETHDEESSGIIDVADILGEGWFLLTMQAPYDIGDEELVTGGQLLAMHVPPDQR